MGIELGSLSGLITDKTGTLPVLQSMFEWMKALTSGLAYFTGGDFGKAVAAGFMK